jgi:hypothetical protein
MEKDEKNNDVKDYNYSAIFYYDASEEEEPTILHMTGRAICPMVKLNPTLL